MRKIIETKNERIDLTWTEVEPRPQRDIDHVRRTIRRLRADEKINNRGYIYRIRTING